jgi:tetratricopeptide (TPR) repeat protein
VTVQDTSAALKLILDRLLGPGPWAPRAQIIDDVRALLDTDAADGYLAVLRARYIHDPASQTRIECFRLALNEGRHRRYRGSEQALSSYFGMFSDDGLLAGFASPPPSGDAEVDAVAFALMLSRSWEERRRILLWAEPLVASGQLEEVFAQLPDSAAAAFQPLGRVIRSVRERGLETIMAGELPQIFLGPSVHRVMVLVNESEAVHLSVWAYLLAPTWKRRLRVLREEGDRLLSDAAEDVFAAIATGRAGQEVKLRHLEIAVAFLEQVKAVGLDAALSAGLPPTFAFSYDLENMGPEHSRSARITALRWRALHLDGDLAPRAWASANLMLADALLGLKWDVAEEALVYESFALEEALLRCNHALAAIGATAAMAPEIRRHALLLTGRALLWRMRGDRSENAETAIRCLEAALSPAGEDVEHDGWVLFHLAMAHQLRVEGVKASNLRTAYDTARRALSAFRSTADVARQQLAAIQLGQILAQHFVISPLDHHADGEEAIRLLESVVADPAAERGRRAAASRVLGHCYVERGAPGDDARAVAAIEAAIGCYAAAQSPLEWAAAQLQLGNAFMRRPDSAANRAAARTCYARALEVPHNAQHRRRTLRASATLLFRERDWSECLKRLDETTDEHLQLEGVARTDAGRIAETADVRYVHERAAYCLLRLGRSHDAFARLDAGKTRQLRHSLDSGQSEGSELSVAEIRALVPPGGALIAPLITSEGSAVFVLCDRDEEPPEGVVIDLGALRDDHLASLWTGTDDDWGCGRALLALNAMRRALAHAALGDDAREAQLRCQAAHELWVRTLDDATSRLWTMLGDPLHRHLADAGVAPGSRVVVLTSKWLSLLPLHAAWRMTPGGRRCLIDDYALSFAPSAAVLEAASRRLRSLPRRAPSLFAVADPTEDLPHARAEVAAVAELFGERASVSAGKQGTVSVVAERARGRSHVHFACHASFDWLDPAGSSLALAEAGRLSARTIAAGLDLSAARLVTLSACETGIVEHNLVPGEFVGLAGAFLQAGAPTVISSLWSIEDESTSALMRELYTSHIRDGLDPAAALRAAQLALRDALGEESAHWAGFVAIGA